MKFKPFTKKYDFTDKELISDFPTYFAQPLYNWFLEVADYANVLDGDGVYDRHYLKRQFRNNLQITFHETIPEEFEDFFKHIYADSDRMANYMALWLQNYTKQTQAIQLEYVLRQGSSAYQVSLVKKDANEYDTGVYDLVMRVPDEVKKSSTDALKNNILAEAWQLAYSRKPDDEKVVTKCCNFLEGYLGKKYFPKDPKPQLKKFVHAFQNKPASLRYLGDTIVSPKNTLTDLLVNVSDIRGQHTEGSGRTPTHEEAIFVLHATIFIWNVDNGATK